MESPTLSKDLIISSLVRAADPELLSISEINDKARELLRVMHRTKFHQLKGLLEVKFPEYKEIIKDICTIHKKKSNLFIGVAREGKIMLRTSGVLYGVEVCSMEGTVKKRLTKDVLSSVKRVEHAECTEKERKMFDFGGAILSSPCLFFIKGYLRPKVAIIYEDKIEEKYSTLLTDPEYQAFPGKNLIVPGL